MLRFAELLESFNALIGRTVAWLTLVMVLLTVVIVLLRYAFDLGWIWLQESVTWMHASVFMLAAAWTLGCDEHVRVDVFYRKLGPRGRAIVDLAGTWLFLVPVSLFLLWSSFGYVEASWAIGETSREAGGLGYPAVPVLKSMIPVTAVMLLLQGIAGSIRNVLVLASRVQVSTPEPPSDHLGPA